MRGSVDESIEPPPPDQLAELIVRRALAELDKQAGFTPLGISEERFIAAWVKIFTPLYAGDL